MIVGLDARGFLVGPIMAAELEIPFVPVSRFPQSESDSFLQTVDWGPFKKYMTLFPNFFDSPLLLVMLFDAETSYD